MKINFGIERSHQIAHGMTQFNPQNKMMKKLALKLVSNFDVLGA